jgi:amino acid adenylation domain-containing protein
MQPKPSFIDLLDARLSGNHAPAFTFLDGDAAETWSFAELGEKARALAGTIQNLTIPGDRVLLVYPPGRDYVLAFVAAALAGVIAVPAVSPSSVKALPRLEAIAADAGARLVLTTTALAARIAEFGGPIALVRSLATDGDFVPASWHKPDLGADDLLFLQYTSGSTGQPKGVMISHGNVLANLAQCRDAFGLVPEDVIVSWLPPHHDFGLIGGILSPLFIGCHTVHLTPLAFLTRPQRWLKAISDWKATVTGAPNFAWELCARKIDDAQKAGLDLSSLRVAINGAERVRSETVADFSAAFAKNGFDPGAMTPAYGLAEATLLVAALTTRKRGQPPRLAQSRESQGETLHHKGALVSNGAAPGAVIVGETGLALPEGEVGEIWVRGPSVARGYWARPAESTEMFGKTVPGLGNGFLRTGDLGFLEGGDLFVSGRSREMLILSGRNLFPQDIEPDVEALNPSFRASGCAVFTAEVGGLPRLIVAQEILGRKDLNTEGLIDGLRVMLLEKHEIADLGGVVLVRAGDLPRTTSGKIQRFACANLFAGGTLRPVWAWTAETAAATTDFAAPRTITEQRLVDLWASLLEVEQVSIHDNFLELSGNSLLATQVISALHQRMGVDVSLRALFENPTIAQLGAEIDRALAEKAAAEAAAGTGPQPRAVSQAQARLFYLDQFAPGDPIYTRSRILRLDGEVQMPALVRAATEVSRRHEVLRYRFGVEDGHPAAVLMPATTVPVVTIAANDMADQHAKAIEFIGKPFDMMAGPLMRIALISEDDDSHLLVLALHAAVADDRSTGMVLGELASLYGSYSEGFAGALDVPKLQHADFVAWQDGWLSGALQQAQTDWWQAQLAGAPALLALPADHCRPAVQTHQGAEHHVFLPSTALPDGPIDTVLGAAFAALLYRYSGQDDISIGLPVALRDLSGTETLIGPLANVLVLRLGLSPEMKMADLARAYADAHAAALAHRDLPFEHVVKAVQPERQLSFSPLFQVMLDIRTAPEPAVHMQGLRSQRVDLACTRAMFDLTLRATAVAGGLELAFEYSTDLFAPATIARAARHLCRLLSDMKAPQATLLAQPLPSAEEIAQLANWNQTTAVYPELQPLHLMFEAQVARTPNALAVMAEGGTLSYGALNTRANRLAHHLRSLGVRPDVSVGLCIERGLEMMVALFAIHKAGGAYVPLDPALPQNRLEYMIGDARPVVILTMANLANRLPPVGVPVLCLDTNWADLPVADQNPKPLGCLQNLAYIIYTSGSTGQPKGVAIDHAGIANRLCWMTRAYDVVPGERVMQKTPYSFDVSVWELFWPLISGAGLVMAKPGGHMDVAYIAGLIRTARITTIHFVPPMLEFFLDLADIADCISLRQVLCSGQALPVALQTRFRQALPDVSLHNLYGPTEASVEVSHWACTPVAGQTSVPIGHPIGNIRLYVLDPAMNPVPVGVAGELFLAGAGLARGYVNRPDLTANSFVPDPFGPPGSRMYRSGDLARHWANGAIEYLGRIDDQVKIRGFRIELGEIETRLQALPGLRDAFVVARDDIAQDRRLVAYLIAAPGHATDEAPLRQALLDALPDYMVPAHFVWVDALPVTLNGKIDRRALPRPDLTRSDEGFAPPQGQTERALAEIWQRLLAVDRVGREDTFFALGGHSLLATQAISKIRERFGVDIALRAILFDQPSVAQLAPVVDGAIASASGSSMTAIRKVPRLAEMDLSFSQKRLWFLDQLEPGNPFYNIPAPTRLSGELDIEALGRALNLIVARHEQLRVVFLTRDDKPVQVVQDNFTLEIPLVDLTTFEPEAAEFEARRLAEIDAQTPFQLDLAPPLRATLVRLGPTEHVILFNMHHIISDGWSMGVLVTEFVAIYRALVEGRENPLPPLQVQYIDFAYWQRDWLQGDTLQRQLDYWKGALADAPPVLSLPTDRPRPPSQSYRGATHQITLPLRLVSELYALGARHQATLFMTLLSAFNVLLSRYSRQEDLCVGTYIANRNRAEIEGLIGFFVNMLVLRSTVSGDASFEDLLLQTRDMALDAYAHQDLPFEYLVDELKPDRHLSHSPLFQVVFVLQNTPMDDLDASGLQTALVQVENGVSKFDLTLRMTEKSGQIDAVFEYATDLFDADTIERMARHFMALLDAITCRPKAEIASLRLVSAPEAAALATLANGADAVAQPAILHGFAKQVARQPDHPAIGGLTYAMLDAASNALAYRLVAKDVRPGDKVALCLDRGPSLVTAILATIKVGAAWVPLDPGLPAARRDFILSDSQPKLVLSEAAHADIFPHALRVDLPATADPANLPGVGPDDVAYVLYTSGTTGQPKGVLGLHRGLMNHAAHHLRLCDLSPADRVLQFASPGFDTSIEEILPSLMAGATLVPRPAGFLDSGAEFDAFLTENAVTIADLPTQFWHQWTKGSGKLPPCLRLVILGGEKLTAGQYADWQARPDTSKIRLINTYGPTEASIIATAHELGAEAGDIPIGRAIDGAILRLLDPQMQPVPPGVPGEIWLGGACLAAGYLNRPDLTAAAFSPDPFGLPDTRLYRTGDLGRMAEDGTVFYLGRVDSQIKLRGFRIEPAEVENALLAAGASAAHVILREDTPGDPRLVAYVTGAEEAPLLATLTARLPGYMVPWRVVVLGSLPLTGNGKVDRRALPVPLGAVSVVSGPRGVVLAGIARVWGEVLGISPDAIGDGDNFFTLGGHSLLATQVISKLRAGFGIELALRVLFEAPTLVGLAPVVEAALRAAAAGGGSAALPAPVAIVRPKDGGMALSFAQQRLWFLDQLDPGDAAYHLPVALRLTGPLDVAAFGAALNGILARHEVLRSTLVLQDGRPVQRVQPVVPLVVALHDLSGLPQAQAEQAASAHIQAEAERPFDLGRDLMLRASLLRLGPDVHVSVVVLHHIAADGWSMGVLLREIAALYEAALGQSRGQNGTPDAILDGVLPPLPVQYADYAAWQRDWLQGPVLEGQLDWWRGQLQGMGGLLALPTDHPRPAVQSHRGGTVPLNLPAPLVAGLTDLARAHGATLHMVLVALLSVLMSRWSGQDDVALGTPVAGRRHQALEGLIGFFVNTLVLRNKVAADQPFDAFLAQVREGALAAQAHQDLPFEHLVEALAPARDLSHAPLFQVMLALQNAPMQALGFGGLTLEPLGFEVNRTKFDLTFGLQEMPGTGNADGGNADGGNADGGGMVGQIEYATDLFAPDTIARLAGQFLALAQAVLAAPETPVGHLALMTPPERSALLDRWQARPGKTLQSNATLADLFAATAAAHPDRIALRAEGVSLTYKALNARANQLAHALQARGITADSLVGLACARGIDMITGILAILKAGGAYLPLDPDHPDDRLAYMLSDAKPTVVLADPALHARLKPLTTAEILPLQPAPNNRTTENPTHKATQQTLAYVIYTSGSTGKPKGVMVPHGPIINRVLWLDGALGVTPEDRIVQKTPYGFDVSVGEIFLPLIAGGLLVIARPGGHVDVPYLARLVRDEAVTIMHFVPPMVEASLGMTDPADYASLRAVMCSGQALPRAVQDRFDTLLPHIKLHNLYGPTETAVEVTHWPCHPDDPRSGPGVPIGRAIDNVAMYVLDDDLEPVPTGVPGHLFIAGMALARGYLNRPDLTAGVFVPDPYAGPGSRMYRSGDRARYLANGAIDYLGRADDQLKIRGVRIEPGEVEAAIMATGIREAVVMARPDQSGELGLIAYVVSVDFDENDTRQKLADLIPDHLMPSAFVVVQALPLTANGKVDRKALPAPDFSSDIAYVAPRTETEARIAAIWASVLGHDRIGINDNFFRLGGHSLRAVMALNQLRQSFDVEIGLEKAFALQTVAMLARHVDSLRPMPAIPSDTRKRVRI